LYSPVLRREQWLWSESKGLLDRLFGGRVAPLVVHFSQQRKLTKRDIAELKRLIEELDDER
jgi:predicted transcriptional regulator